MTQAHRVLWGEGMFLLPQHFQQSDRYWEARLGQALETVRMHPWGVRQIAWDREALNRGLLRAESFDAVFQDGTAYAAPGQDPLPEARLLDEIPNLGTEVLIHACLPLWNPHGGNVESADPLRGRAARFKAADFKARDLFTQAVEGEVQGLHPNVSLRLGVENRDGCLGVIIGRLRRTPAGGWALDDGYIPPVAEAQGAPALLGLLRRMLEILQVKAQALASAQRERVKSVADFGASDVAGFWLLHAVHRSFPLLSHYQRFPRVHPEDIYLALSQLAGELLTFSTAHTLADIPPYQHDKLTETFQALEDLLRRLLDTVISSKFVVIPLSNPRPSFHVGHLDSDRLLEKTDFYLSVSGEQPASFFLEELPMKLKVGSPDDVEKILHSALPGVRLAPVSQPPMALPARVGNHYFALEPGGIIFERILKARSICIYVPQTLPSFRMELYALHH